MPTIEKVVKDPDSNEWFQISWIKRLANTSITIVTSLWDVTDGTLIQEDKDISGQFARVRLSGGTLGSTHRIINKITTSDTQTLEYSLDFVIQQE